LKHTIYISKNGFEINSRVPLPKKKGDYVYFIKIGNERLYKIGTTNRPMARMKEHLKYYNENIEILWFSPCYAEFTPIRVERKFIKKYQQNPLFEYVRNDRFIIDESVTEIIVTVRKDYPISL
jgi:predicted GIY-YIG superfamily endonuclease